jgi:hypothetical protein
MRVIDWINLAQDREKCWAAVNTVMELLGSVKFGELFD